MNQSATIYLDLKHYFYVYSRCSESSRPEATALKDFLSVEEVKVMCLFLSLPPSMENIIDNLSTKENVKFADVNKRLLDLSATKITSIPSSNKAYSVENTNTRGEKILECTWCKKHGGKYKGHVHSKCLKLQKHLEQKSKNQNKQKFNDVNRAHIAMDSSEDSLSNIKYADIGHDKAFLAAHSTSPSFWILDSGCSAHMISRKDLLSNIVPNNGIVNLANGM